MSGYKNLLKGCEIMIINDVKRLEQENAELKAKIKKYAAINEQETKDYAELKAENERLKTQYNCYACGNCKGKEDYINLEKHHIGLGKEFDKKVQTLQEIKAIAENCISKDACFECKYSDDCYIEDAEIPTYDICKLLIQLITKAEEE